MCVALPLLLRRRALGFTVRRVVRAVAAGVLLGCRRAESATPPHMGVAVEDEGVVTVEVAEGSVGTATGCENTPEAAASCSTKDTCADTSAAATLEELGMRAVLVTLPRASGGTVTPVAAPLVVAGTPSG